MKPFSNLRASHHAAFMLLLVWLFSLASGIAHACLLEASATRHDGGVTPAPEPFQPTQE